MGLQPSKPEEDKEEAQERNVLGNRKSPGEVQKQNFIGDDSMEQLISPDAVEQMPLSNSNQ